MSIITHPDAIVPRIPTQKPLDTCVMEIDFSIKNCVSKQLERLVSPYNPSELHSVIYSN